MIEPTVSDLAVVTGSDPDSFGGFATQAISMAALAFRRATRRTDWPEDPDEKQLAAYAILQLAQRLYLEQPYSEAMASPFASESTGTYSYSKSFQKAANGLPTDLMWWDMAIDQLTLAEGGNVSSNGVKLVNQFFRANDGTDDRYILGPAELRQRYDQPFDDNPDVYTP